MQNIIANKKRLLRLKSPIKYCEPNENIIDIRHSTYHEFTSTKFQWQRNMPRQKQNIIANEKRLLRLKSPIKYCEPNENIIDIRHSTYHEFTSTKFQWQRNMPRQKQNIIANKKRLLHLKSPIKYCEPNENIIDIRHSTYHEFTSTKFQWQ